MPDPQDLGQLIDGFGIDAAGKDRTWNAYHTSQDSDSLQRNLDGLPLSADQKTALWNHWHATRAAGVSPQTQKLGPVPALKQAINVQTPFGDVGSAIDWTTQKAIPAVVGGVKRAGQAISEAAQQPHTTFPMVGSIVGAMATPEAPTLGAGLGGFGGDIAASAYEAARGRRPANVLTSATEAGMAGVGGEMIPGIGRARPLQTEEGQLVEKLYGKTALPHQMTESSLLDFLYNISRGMTGAPRMAAQEEAQRGVEAATVRGLTHRISPGVLPPDEAAKGIRYAAADAFDKAQQPVQGYYRNWLKHYGDVAEQTILGGKGPSVAQLHELRSQALSRGRDALADGDGKAAFEANKVADDALQRIKALVGPDGAAAYDQMGSLYRKVMETYDNPLMNKLRRGVHPEQLADMMLNPEASFPKVTPLGEKVSQDIPTMIGRIRQALPAESWRDLQASTLQRLYENSVRLSSRNATVGELSAKSMKDQINRMGPGAFQSLFGDNAQAIKDFADAVAAAHRKPSETGKFFIDLRQAAAVSAVAGGAVGMLTQSKERGEEAAIGAGAVYMVAPWALARLMTNPTTRALFIRGLEESDPTIKQQIAQGLTRMLSQGATSGAASLVKPQAGQPVRQPTGRSEVGDVQIPTAPRPRQ